MKSFSIDIEIIASSSRMTLQKCVHMVYYLCQSLIINKFLFVRQYIIKFIAFLTLLTGYFMGAQNITASSRSENPIFERPDWFLKEDWKVIFVVGQFEHTEEHLTYNIDREYNAFPDQIFNCIIRGISPIAQLQYWNVQYQELDNLIYQLDKLNKSYAISTENDYQYLLQEQLNIIKLNSYQDYANIIDKYDFLYIDNCRINMTQILKLQSQNTMWMILDQSKLHILTQRQYQGTYINQAQLKMDSITSSIASILDIPIPLQNHGVMIPWLVFECKNEHKFGCNPHFQEINNLLMNQEQLYLLFSLLEQHNKYHKSQEKNLLRNVEIFQNFTVHNSPIDEVKLIEDIYRQSNEISVLINSEISGNRLILFLGLVFTITSSILYIRQTKVYPSLMSILFGMLAIFTYEQLPTNPLVLQVNYHMHILQFIGLSAAIQIIFIGALTHLINKSEILMLIITEIPYLQIMINDELRSSSINSLGNNYFIFKFTVNNIILLLLSSISFENQPKKKQIQRIEEQSHMITEMV